MALASCLWATAGAQTGFRSPTEASDGWTRGATSGSLFAAWELFGSPFGPNAPDAGLWLGGVLPPDAAAFDLYDEAAASGSFITSSGNIYSFNGILTPVLTFPGFGGGDGFRTTVLVQVRTLGNELDPSTATLDGEPAVFTEELFREPFLGSFGGFTVERVYRFELTGDASGRVFRVVAGDLSVSLDRLELDVFVEASCAADLTGDGVANIFDILRFFDLFGAGDASADLAADGSLDIFDILAFFEVFGAGC